MNSPPNSEVFPPPGPPGELETIQSVEVDVPLSFANFSALAMKYRPCRYVIGMPGGGSEHGRGPVLVAFKETRRKPLPPGQEYWK